MMRLERKEEKGSNVVMPVLIVDDDPFLAHAFQIILEDAGFYVETAATGAQALSKAETTHFRLVITDLNLPDIQGDELSQRLKGMIPGVSVILLTGSASSQKLEEAPNKVLKNPIDPLQLLRASTSLSANM